MSSNPSTQRPVTPPPSPRGPAAIPGAPQKPPPKNGYKSRVFAEAADFAPLDDFAFCRGCATSFRPSASANRFFCSASCATPSTTAPIPIVCEHWWPLNAPTACPHC